MIMYFAGHYGMVHLGRLHQEGATVSVPVAIKSLKGNACGVINDLRSL